MRHEDQSLIEPLGLFGGTFDPVHYGHLRCAEQARQKLKLKKLSLLPVGNPPHRKTPQATIRQRLEMLKLAQLEFPLLDIDERETLRSGPSYMVDTLQELHSQTPHRPILLLMGQDTANQLHSWYHWEQLFVLSHIVILTRPGAKAEYRQDLAKLMQRQSKPDLISLLHSEAGGVLHLDVSPTDISATTIKSIILLGRSPGSMLPAAVLDYINENRLYARG